MAMRRTTQLVTATAIAAYLAWRWRSRLRPAVYLRRQGLLVGDAAEGIARFLGVPFAASPAGPHRWRVPRPAPRWWLYRRNPRVLYRGPQPDEGWNKRSSVFGGVEVEDSEAGVLQLNIWTPEAALDPGAGLRPIVFYIHGGAGKLMSAHDDDYCGAKLAATHGLVYVAAQYRLGALGFLAHPGLSAEDEDDRAQQQEGRLHGSGNYATLDLLAALEWVQTNGRGARSGPRSCQPPCQPPCQPVCLPVHSLRALWPAQPLAATRPT